MKCNSKPETLIGRNTVFLVGSLSSSLREQALTSPMCLVRKAGFVHQVTHGPSCQGSESHPIAVFLGHICLPSPLPRTLRGEQGQEESYAVLSKSTPF